MISVIVIAGFFLVMTAALSFSTWAEGWMVPTARSLKKGHVGAQVSIGIDSSATDKERESIQAA